MGNLIKGINDLATVHPELLAEWDYDKNVDISPEEVPSSSDVLVWWKCKKCHHEWHTPVSRRSAGKGCPVCANKIIKAGYNDLATICPDIAKEWDFAKNGDITPKTVSKGSKKEVWWICSKCGKAYQAQVSSRTRGRGCPYCAGKHKTTDSFKTELHTVNKDIIVIDEYKGARTPIRVKCAVCNSEWLATPTNLLKGRRCPVCSRQSRGLKRRKPDSDFCSQMKLLNPNIELLDPYSTIYQKIRVKCKICSNEWMVTPASLLRGNGCPRCARTGTSYVEQLILLSLQHLCSFPVLSRDKSAIGMELDIYIPALKYAIEYGAWPWHINKVDRDNLKKHLCIQKGINLIQIFDAYDGIDKNSDTIWFYQENIGKKENSLLVKEIIIRICTKLGIPFTLTDNQYSLLQEQARLNARTLTTARLNEKLADIRTDVVVLGEYKDALSKVLAQCKTCGHQWEVIPASLLRGMGCPKCAVDRRSKPKKTKEQFIAELESINPDIQVLGDYNGVHKSIRVNCLKHNVVYETTPSSLLRGSGCPKCRNEKIKAKQRKSPEQFKSEVHTANNNIELIGTYVNQKTKIKAKCKVCSYEFDTWPDTLLRGGGCPKCARKKQAETRRFNTRNNT